MRRCSQLPGLSRLVRLPASDELGGQPPLACSTCRMKGLGCACHVRPLAGVSGLSGPLLLRAACRGGQHIPCHESAPEVLTRSRMTVLFRA